MGDVIINSQGEEEEVLTDTDVTDTSPAPDDQKEIVEASVEPEEAEEEEEAVTNEYGMDEVDLALLQLTPEGNKEYLESESQIDGSGEYAPPTGSPEDYGFQALGGVLDTIENTGDLVGIPQLHKAIDEKAETLNMDFGKLVFNIQGFENYNSKKPVVFFMDDDEWDKRYAKGQISFMPQIEESESMGAQVTRDLVNVVAGLIGAGKFVKGAKAILPTVKTTSKVATGAKKFAGFTSIGTIGGLMSYKPYEPRLADSMADFVERTPFEVLKPFFDWMSAEDTNSKAEERFKIALESMILDGILVGAYSMFFKLFKRERALLKAEAGGATTKELDEVNELEFHNISSQQAADVVHPPHRTPTSQKAQLELDEIKKGTKGDTIVKPGDEGAANKVILEAHSLSPGGLGNVIKEITEALIKGEDVALRIGRDTIVNTNKLSENGSVNLINALSNEIEAELKALGKKIPKNRGQEVRVGQEEIRTFEIVEGEALTFASFIRNSTQRKEFELTAEALELDPKKLFDMMKPDIKTLAQLDARMVAYRIVLDDLTANFVNRLSTSNLDSRLVRFNFITQLDELNKLWGGFSQVPRGGARMTSAGRIKMKKEWMNADGTLKADMDLTPKQVHKRNQFLESQLDSRTGTDKNLLKSLREVGALAIDPIERTKNLRKAARGANRGAKAFLEVYRGLLLMNLKTFTTNLLSNTFETLVIPTSRLVGSMASFNYSGVKEQVGFFYNMLASTRKATLAGMDSLIHERNLLDPLRTKAEQSSEAVYRGYMMQMDKAVDAGYWHPHNWIPLLVNATGKTSRLSLRVLASQDEFFKTLNYNGKALSKITKAVPDGASRAERKTFIKRNLGKFYDENGEAIDKDLLDYSRRVVFQEKLESGWANDIHLMVDRHPVSLGIFLPFVRTPANILSRFLQRTPVLNLASKRTRAMLRSGDQEQIAEVIGNTVLGVGLWGSAVGYSVSGNVTGSGPLDPDKNRLWVNAGNQPYSVKIGDTWYRYDRLDPLMLPFVYAATLNENLYKFRNDPDSIEEGIGVFIAASMKAFTDRTYLRGLKTIFDGINQAIYRGNAEYFLRTMTTNPVPSIIFQVADIAGMGENNGTSGFREAITWQEKFFAKLAPISGYDAVKHNWLTGEPVLTPTGHNIGLARTDRKPNKYMMELLRMKHGFSPPSKKIGTIDLTGKQYARLSELIGTTKIDNKTLMETIEALMESPEYAFDENRKYHPDFDDPRVKAVKKVVSTYKRKGKFELINEDFDLFNKYKEQAMEKAEVGAGLFTQ